MSERKIHTMWNMIAIRDGDKVLAVFPNAFGQLTNTLLSDLDQMERISFKMAASSLSTTYVFSPPATDAKHSARSM